MSVRQAILQRLRASSNAAVEPAVEAALAHATPREQRELAEVLLTRGRRPGWIALVRCFHQLPDDLQDYLLEHPKDLFGPLSDTMDDGRGAGRVNVIEIVRKAADPKLLFLLTEALSDGRAEVRQLAAAAILEAIRRYQAMRLAAWEKAGDPVDPAAPVHAPPDPAHLRRAVDFALRQFKTHRNDQVVLAALLFERQQDSPLWAIFEDPYEETTRTAIQILRQFSDPSLITAALLALGSPLKSAAIAGLSYCDNPAALPALAQESYRLLDAELAHPMQAVAHPRLLMNLPTTPLADPQRWFDYFRLVDHMAMAPPQKLPWLLWLNDNLPKGPQRRPAKLLLIRALAALRTPDAFQVLMTATNDPDEAVARSAARCIVSRRQSDWRACSNTLLQSPHESVRKLVSQAVTPGQFERLWHDYLRLPPAVQVLSTRTLSETDSQFNDMLRGKLSSADPVDNAQGLKMLLTLQNLKPFRDQIISLCAHGDPRIVATAVRLVGRLEDARFKDLLEAAARHHDPRVRANAIESMEQLHVADRSQQVLAMLNSRFNRERANAIRAISHFNFSTARECLLRMLADAAPQHRISALWVVGQLDLLEIVRQVGTLARRDPNQHVRKRAEEVLQQLQDAAAAASGLPLNR